MGPAPKNMYNPHRHHIVREHAPSNWSADARKWITDSQDIIAKVGIDLNSSIENFVWASNGLGNHSKKTAKTVYDLSLIHISEPTRLHKVSRMPSSA